MTAQSVLMAYYAHCLSDRVFELDDQLSRGRDALCFLKLLGIANVCTLHKETHLAQYSNIVNIIPIRTSPYQYELKQ